MPMRWTAAFVMAALVGCGDDARTGSDVAATAMPDALAGDVAADAGDIADDTDAGPTDPDATAETDGDTIAACPVDCGAAAGACRAGRCVDGECVFEAANEGAACDDTNLCTSADHCAGGACVGDAVTCAAPVGACQKPGACAPQTGACVYVDACADGAACVNGACTCPEGFRGDGITACADIDECAEHSDGCDLAADCMNQVGTYACVCPDGYWGDGVTCIATDCACPWEDEATCGPELGRLRVGVTDLWGQAMGGRGARVMLIDAETEQIILFEDLVGGAIEQPLCAARDLFLLVESPDHHVFEGTLFWLENDLFVDVPADRDSAWSLGWDAAGPVVWVGLAHRWFASSGRPARLGNDATLLMDGEDAWGAVHAAIRGAESLVTGTSWWWESDVELVRGADHLTLDADARWHNTVLGVLEDLAGVNRKIMVGQFVSQDGLFSNVTIDALLRAKGEAWGDDFEYMGQANPSQGRWIVTPPAIDYRGRIEAALTALGAVSGLIDGADASPFADPITVDTTRVPLGLSYTDIPLASWHQKFWTIDQKVAFIGGMNAKGNDWDSSEHRVFDPRRMAFGADWDERNAVVTKESEPDFGPRKDYMMRLEGPSVGDAVDVFARRWQHQRDTNAEYADRSTPVAAVYPPAPIPDGVQAQVIATMPAPFDEVAILETLLRAVSQARHFIYIEDQYFRAPILYDAIVRRMTEVPGLQLVVVTNPVSEWTDPGCYQTAIAYQMFRALFPDRFRSYRLRAFDYVRTDCTVCWDETEAHFVDFDLHAKLVIIDDEFLEIGSCNSNNRGLLYEGELAAAVHDAGWVLAQRTRIFENLLGPGYAGDMHVDRILAAFDERAWNNQAAYQAWDSAGMDLDLDGESVPAAMLPSGFLYPLVFDAPDACLIEGIGADVM